MEKIRNSYAFFLRSASTTTFKNSFVSFAGTGITGILGVIFYAFVARSLGPNEYGVFSVTVATIALLSSITNVGLDTGLLKFVSRDAHTQSLKPVRITKLAFEIKIAMWLLVLVFGWVLMPTVANVVLNKPELLVPFRIALFGVGATMLSSFATTLLQAHSRFLSWSIVNIFSNLTRLIIVVVIGTTIGLNLYATLWAYIGVMFIVFLFKIITDFKFLKVQGEWKYFVEFMSFNKWIAVFTVIAAIGSRIDTYLAARFMSLTDVGIYSVGVSLVGFITQIVLALGSVVATKLSNKSRPEFLLYFKKLQLFVGILTVIGILIGIPIGALIIPLVYGSSYAASVIPFSILLVAQAIFLFAVPVHTSVIYYFSYPKLFVYITLFRLALTFIVGLVLIPQYQAVGAAISVLIGNISDFIIPSIWVTLKLRK